jgi:demethylmenaquinone methyltransferase/2-methoxy-6-polyprenyl-1,4-benzoquinol methylase
MDSQYRFFRWLSPFYDHLIRRPEIDRLTALLRMPSNGRLLDVGGGTGRVSQHFTSSFACVVVCDINRSMLIQSRRKKWLLPIQSDASVLPFSSETFDGILIVDAMHHFHKPRKAIYEMSRVLRPGGRLLIEEQDIQHPLIRLINLAERAFGLHSTFLTCQETMAMFEKSQHELYCESGASYTFRVLAALRSRVLAERSGGQH